MLPCNSCGQKLLPGSLFCDACGAAAQQVQVARKLRQTSFDTIKDTKGGLLVPAERIRGRKTYLIEESVARSGFGATFRATRLNDKKQLLIKQMIDQSSYDQFKDQLIKSFKREAKFLNKIKHPAFPRGYEYFEKNKSFYMVMDFINGKDLNKVLEDYKKQNSKIEDGLLIYLGIEIGEALEIVHQHGFIYRDLKPHNVMVDGISNRIKLIDFGTLYHPSDKNPLLFESEGYTPPEFKDADSSFQPSGDIYSLGALLYEVLAGETPIPDQKLKDFKIDERLKVIIEKCLEKDPAKRYQKVSQLKGELKKLTKKGLWPFSKRNVITPVEISVLPKALFPSTCTFCDYCGYADAQSQTGYCPTCRIPLKVGQIVFKDGKQEKEFFLFADKNVLGNNSKNKIQLPASPKMLPEHAKIFRRNQNFFIEAADSKNELPLLNQRKIIGPIELKEGDTVTLGDFSFQFFLKEAC